jgi:hypothetical protein
MVSAVRERKVRRLALVWLALLLIPAWATGEVVRLRDGSTLKGKLVRVDGDTLTVRLSIGAAVKVHRAQVESIVFSDSVVVAPSPTASGAAAVAVPEPAGAGGVAIAFKDRGLSSKIVIEKKKDWDAHVRSNAIVVEFFVDGRLAYTAADTTTDKTIYNGHERVLKNDVKLEDFTVEVPSGVRQCSLVIRNADPDTFRKAFDPEPLKLVLAFDELAIRPGATTRIDVGIDRGTMRLANPKLYRVDGSRASKD